MKFSGMGYHVVVLFGALTSNFSVAATSKVPQPAEGILVETVEVGFAGDQAGLREGDLLLAWQRATPRPTSSKPAGGRIDSPFDLLELELEQAPQGRLLLLGTRSGAPLRVKVPPGAWNLQTRPRLTRPVLAIYQEAAGQIERGEVTSGLLAWSALASELADAGDPGRASWLSTKIATVATQHRDRQRADDAWQQARRWAQTTDDRSHMAAIADVMGQSLQNRREIERATEAYQNALDLRQEISPLSLGVASSLNRLGQLALIRGDLSDAEGFFQRALPLQEQLAPESLALALSLNNLGIVAGRRGDIPTAEAFFRRALVLRQRLAPHSLDTASSLNALGIIARNRGDLVASEDFHRRALALREQLAPYSLDVALSLNNLGGVAWYRGDLAAAEDYCLRALVIRERLIPKSIEVAVSLNNLGGIAFDHGDMERAEEVFLRALAILEQRAPQSLESAMVLLNLGETALKLGDLDPAEDYLQRSFGLYEALAPRGVDTAQALRLLGDIAFLASDLETAEVRFQRSLDIQRQRNPGSADEAETCQRLAKLHLQRADPQTAITWYDCAVDALEAQQGMLGGSDEVRSGFGAKYADIYREAIHLRIEEDQDAEAFHLLERYRARELLALLAQRDLIFSSDLPEDLETRRQAANRSYDRALGQWLKLPDQAEDSERQQASEQLEQARRRQDEIRAEIRTAAPRLAALQDPRPLDLKATQAALEDGTLLLSYVIGSDRSHLFAIGPGLDEFRTFRVPADGKRLHDTIERFRNALRQGQFDRRPGKALDLAQQLSQTLLGSVVDQIERADRLLILADGPLHSLPFAALTAPWTGDSQSYLIASKPIHLAASAAVFALLQGERREPRAMRLTAFGDPHYPLTTTRDEATAPQVRAAQQRGLELTQLPATRVEVESLARLYPQSAQIYLGVEATEGRAKAVGRETTHLHIASHGLLDDRFPLDSALAFSIPRHWQEGDDNGLLQAWEIFEQLRLDADLVTLSACDTGLGKVMGGEGLQGLTRAFQYAGARSVLASLWSVSDISTGELMQRFYGYLKTGQSKAEALQSAQLDLVRSSRFSHPFHWAGFVLVGDWI